MLSRVATLPSLFFASQACGSAIRCSFMYSANRISLAGSSMASVIPAALIAAVPATLEASGFRTRLTCTIRCWAWSAVPVPRLRAPR